MSRLFDQNHRAPATYLGHSASRLHRMARKKRMQETELSTFIREYRRKRQKREEPNDRGYDRKLEAKIKRMKPEDVDELLRGSDEKNE